MDKEEQLANYIGESSNRNHPSALWKMKIFIFINLIHPVLFKTTP